MQTAHACRHLGDVVERARFAGERIGVVGAGAEALGNDCETLFGNATKGESCGLHARPIFMSSLGAKVSRGAYSAEEPCLQVVLDLSESSRRVLSRKTEPIERDIIDLSALGAIRALVLIV